MWKFNWGVFWAVLAAVAVVLVTPLLLSLFLRTAIHAILAWVKFSQSKVGDIVALGFVVLLIAGFVGWAVYIVLTTFLW